MNLGPNRFSCFSLIGHKQAEKATDRHPGNPKRYINVYAVLCKTKKI